MNSTTGTTALKNHHRKCQAEHDHLAAAAATGAGAAGMPTHVGPSSQASSFDPQAYREALKKYIVGTNMPISLGEQPDHIEYVRSLVPDYQPVTRNTSRSDLEKYYRKRRAALVQELEKGTFNVAFTSDVWSGRAKENYISAVIHYIYNDKVLNKRIIGFRLLDVRHIGVNIAQCIINMLEDFTLQICVIAFTMDNPSFND